jgi:gluconolactonase
MNEKSERLLTEANPVSTTCWLEGPVCDALQNIYFTDVRGNRILRQDRDGQLTVFRGPQAANYPNGQALDPQGRLVTCEEGDPETNTPPRLTRTDLETNAVEVLADNFEGQRFCGPSDVAIDRKGNIYFSDGVRPFFLAPFTSVSSRVPATVVRSPSVFRLNSSGVLKRILGDGDVLQPNGVALSPDERTLYVVENDISEAGTRQLRSFALTEEGLPLDRTVLVEFSPGRSADGLAVDVDGNLYVAAGLNRLRGTAETLATPAGIHVFSPLGEKIDFIPVYEDSVTNVTFGGNDMRDLYITAGKTLFKARCRLKGARR